MHAARDSFYLAMRARLGQVNAGRVVTVRGVGRPGVLVLENELASMVAPMDCFALRWTALVEAAVEAGMMRMDCQIEYGTKGTLANGGLDRGRMLAAMDAELLAMLAPPRTPLVDATQVPPAALGGMVFWGVPVFGEMVVEGDAVRRVATVQVFAAGS